MHFGNAQERYGFRMRSRHGVEKCLWRDGCLAVPCTSTPPCLSVNATDPNLQGASYPTRKGHCECQVCSESLIVPYVIWEQSDPHPSVVLLKWKRSDRIHGKISELGIFRRHTHCPVGNTRLGGSFSEGCFLIASGDFDSFPNMPTLYFP